MQMNKESSWLLDKAAKEDGARVSVGGLIGDIATGNTEPMKFQGIKIYTWPSEITYPFIPGQFDPGLDHGFYRPQPRQPRGNNFNLKDALEAAQELAIKERESKAAKQAEQAADYLDPEVDKLEKKLKDIQSNIEIARMKKQRRKENQAKIESLKKQIEEAEKLLFKENQY